MHIAIPQAEARTWEVREIQTLKNGEVTSKTTTGILLDYQL